MSAFEIRVDRRDIRQAQIVETTPPEPAEGQALLAVDGFALTTNNVTYAATGEVIGYWKFFPLAQENAGLVPVWGFARVLASRNAALDVGQYLYGFLPMASHLLITPKAQGAHGLIDAAPHRAELPAVYNRYFPVSPPTQQAAAERALFQPLLATSYLIQDFLADNGYFAAKQVIIGSASSKTGIGLAAYLAEAGPDAPEIIGLTSEANRAFVERLGFCDQVVSYDTLEDHISHAASVFVDMAGNADIRRRLHEHLQDAMVYSCAVGTSHWDKFAQTGTMPGAKPRFFFAPSQIEKRRADWGAELLNQRIEAAWQRVAAQSGDWLQIRHRHDAAAALESYRALSLGQVAPDQGLYLHLD